VCPTCTQSVDDAMSELSAERSAIRDVISVVMLKQEIKKHEIKKIGPTSLGWSKKLLKISFQRERLETSLRIYIERLLKDDVTAQQQLFSPSDDEDDDDGCADDGAEPLATGSSDENLDATEEWFNQKIQKIKKRQRQYVA